MKNLMFLIALVSSGFVSHGQIDSVQLFVDSLEASLQYQHGEVKLENEIGILRVPETFGYLDAQQARFVLESLWGNPEDSTVLGMIVPANRGVMADDSWAFIVTYDEMGYVKDDDANDIDYAELLDELQADTKEENEFRTEAGYDPIELVGWASEPYYDADEKVLHWAKEIKFGESEFNTLNYNVRILGRKGVLVLNAVAPMESLNEVKESINPVLSSFAYNDGLKYSDFDPKIDDVAAWTIGGLVAGKVLAKTGLLALLLKNIKLVLIGLAAVGTGLWRWFKSRTTLPDVKNIEGSDNT